MGFLSGGSGGNFNAVAPVLNEHYYNNDLNNAIQQVAPGLSASTATGQRQMSLADLLDAQSRGQGPSVAQDQLQAATDRTGKQAASLIGSQRGLNPALAARQVLQAQAGANQEAANQSAQLRANEMLQGRQLYGQNLASQRAQDIGQYQAGMEGINTIGNLNNAQNQIRSGAATATNNTNAQMASQNSQNQAKGMGGLLQGLGAAAGTAVGGPVGGAFGSAIGGTLAKASGGKIPGQPEVPGDSPKNDKVPAWLSPGEIVIPRSIAHDPEAARDFVAKINTKKYSDGGPVDDNIELDPEKVKQFKSGFSEGGEIKKQTNAQMSKEFMAAMKEQHESGPEGYSKVLKAKKYSDGGKVNPKAKTGGDTASPTDTSTETGGSSPGGASTGGVGSGIGGAGTGGAATGGASTGGAGTVNVTISGNSGTGSNKGGGKGKSKGGGSESPININISNVGGKTDAGNTTSGDGPGASGEGGSGRGSGGGGGGAAPSEPENFSSSHEDTAKKVLRFSEGGAVSSPTKTNTETGGSSPGGASTGGVGSGLGGAGTGGAATGGASTGGAGTVNTTLSGNSGTGSNGGGKGKEAPVKVSDVGGKTRAGDVTSGSGPGAEGIGGKGGGSGGGGGGASPDEFSDGGQVKRKAFMGALKESREPGPKGYSKVLEAKRRKYG